MDLEMVCFRSQLMRERGIAKKHRKKYLGVGPIIIEPN